MTCPECGWPEPRHQHKCEQRAGLVPQLALWLPMTYAELRILAASLYSGWVKQSVHAGYGTPVYTETLALMDELHDAENAAFIREREAAA